MRTVHTQKGIAAIMMVLLLIVFVALILALAFNMTQSETWDTHSESAAVKALFLAESGVERASWRFIDGTACTDLAVDGPHGLGQGSFTVVNAYDTEFDGATALAGNACRVRVTGNVGQHARTLEAIIQIPVTSAGWAVGKKVGGNVTIIYWDGSAWTSQTPASAVNKSLEGVYALSANDAWAVGEDGAILHYTGSWQSVSSPTNKDLMSVSCVDADNCWAAGEEEAGILHWDGSSWHDSDSHSLDEVDEDLESISMVSTSFGFAVGKDGVIMYYDGSWSEDPQSEDVTEKDLNDVYCVDASNCWAVGDKEDGHVTIIYWDGSNWSLVSGGDLPSPAVNEHLNGVYCVDASNCWATGEKTDGNIVVLRMSGSSWSQVTGAALPSPAINKEMEDIYCASTSDCWVVGDTTGGSGVTIRWDGSAWTRILPVPVNKEFNDIHFPADAGGGGGSSEVLLQWREAVTQ
jgi:hypothetical protein